jgi:hypothetical protein
VEIGRERAPPAALERGNTASASSYGRDGVALRALLDPVAYLDASKNRRRTDEQEIDCNDRG